MIDIKSLRIGNIIKDQNGNLREVAYITECIGLKNDIGGIDKYQKDPITSFNIETLRYAELTEEMLLKCEGVENEFDMCLNINDRVALAIDIKPNGVIATIFTEYDEFEVKCDYLNELQNLIKSLTGKELQINL